MAVFSKIRCLCSLVTIRWCCDWRFFSEGYSARNQNEYCFKACIINIHVNVQSFINKCKGSIISNPIAIVWCTPQLKYMMVWFSPWKTLKCSSPSPPSHKKHCHLHNITISPNHQPSPSLHYLHDNCVRTYEGCESVTFVPVLYNILPKSVPRSS